MPDRLPLSALMSQVLVALRRDLRPAAGGQALPSLTVWTHVVRHVGDDGLDASELPRRARLSRRAVRALVSTAERQGWLVIDAASGSGAGKGRGRGKIVRLTPQGRAARSAWAARIEAVERDWRGRFGDDRIDALRQPLVALVGRLDLELPHLPTGTRQPTSASPAPATREPAPRARHPGTRHRLVAGASRRARDGRRAHRRARAGRRPAARGAAVAGAGGVHDRVRERGAELAGVGGHGHPATSTSTPAPWPSCPGCRA